MSQQNAQNRARRTHPVRVASTVVVLCAYPIVAHYAAISSRPEMAIAAWLAIALLLFWPALSRTPHRLALAGVALLPVALITSVGWGMWLIYAPPILINLTLAMIFGRSLTHSHTPIITFFALLERGELSPELNRYTRTLTAIWTALFLAMAGASLGLAVFADPGTWSLFTNGLSYLLVAVLFLGEFIYRRIRYSSYTHASPIQLARLIHKAGGIRGIRATR